MLYFTASIINELSSFAVRDRLILLVIVTIMINLLLMVVKNILSRKAEISESNLWLILRKMYSDKMLQLDFIDYEDTTIRDLYNELGRDLNGMGFGLARIIFSSHARVRGLIQIVFALVPIITMFSYPIPQSTIYGWLNSPYAIIFVLAMLAGSILLAPYFSTKGSRIWERLSADNNKGNQFFNYYFFNMIEGTKTAKDIRIYSQNKLIEDHISNDESMFSNLIKGKSKWLQYSNYFGKYTAIASGISYLCYGFVFSFIALKAYVGAFGIGNVLLYIGVVTQFGTGFLSLISGIAEITSSIPYLEKLFSFLDISNDMYQGSLTTEKRSDMKYEFQFKNVSFKYPGSDTYALQNVSMKINVGQRMAVVGENGSGKTTFIKLLCRLYDPTEGVILLNGIDIKKYNYREYMDIFSIVFQDFSLLPFSLGQNVATKVDYNKSEVMNTLSQVGLSERLSTMPCGLDTYLYTNFNEEGIEISGGEAQKVALARALYKDAPFIVFDEPTAALDPIAEFEIYRNMNEIIANKTTIFISHRLSSCRFCNDISVFHEGRLIQRGSHDELLVDSSGKYSELWNAQAKYYVDNKIPISEIKYI